MKTLIKNCHLISDNREIANAFIKIEDTLISEIGEGAVSEVGFDKIIDADGSYALPGFIDIHTHGALGFHTCDGTLESIERIAESKMREGVTTFCPSTVTMPEDVLFAAMEGVKAYKSEDKYAKVAGVHLEGPFFNPNKLGGQNPAFVQLPNIDLIKRLKKICEISIVSFSPEIDGALEFTAQLKELGIVASCAHSEATYEDIVKAKQCGLTHLTHFCNQMTGIHHRNVGAVGAGLLDDDLSVELICDKIHLCPEMIKLIFKCKALSSIMLITDSSYLSGLPDGEHELRGLKIVIKDGIVRLAGSDTLCGSGLRYNIGLKNVAEITKKSLKELVRTTSLNQACMLGLRDVGKLEKGFIADIILLDRDFDIKSVFIDGQKKAL